MNCLCCKVDSICHMDTSGYYSLVRCIVNSSVDNTQYCIWIFVGILVILFVLLVIILYLFYNMSNKNREYQNSISSEISKINQTIKCSINNSIRSAFDDYSSKYDKYNECEHSYNESLIKLYFLLIKIQGNIDLCYNKNSINDFIDEIFKFQSNHITAVILLNSVRFPESIDICKLLDQFEDITKKILHERDNFPNHKYDKEIEDIKHKLDFYAMMLKNLLNLK